MLGKAVGQGASTAHREHASSPFLHFRSRLGKAFLPIHAEGDDRADAQDDAANIPQTAAELWVVLGLERSQ